MYAGFCCIKFQQLKCLCTFVEKKFRMRTIHIILLVTILTWLTSCTTSVSYPTIMQQAEECMNIHPDSALTLLEGLEDNITDYHEEVQMYWHLLTI